MNSTDVSKKFDLSQDTLRYYERIELIPSVNRNKSEIKLLTQKIVRLLEKGLHLLKYNRKYIFDTT